MTKKKETEKGEDIVLRVHLLVQVKEGEQEELVKELSQYGEVAKVVRVQKPEDIQLLADSTPGTRGVNPPGQQGPVGPGKSEYDAYGNRYDGQVTKMTHDAYGNPYTAED